MCNVREQELERELWVKSPDGDWEYLDHEAEGTPIKDLIREYSLDFGSGYQFEIRRPDDFQDDVEEID